MRIGIGGINHETNTYCPQLTPLSAFTRLTGERLLRRSGTETPVGGAIDACRALGIEPIPLMAAWTQPSGIIEASAYETLKQDILDTVAAEWPLDGIFLDLHGAGVAEGVSDLEGDLTEAIRAQVGSVPIVATFDLHGNVTQRMADQLDGVFACHEYPHIDLHHRAREAIELILRMQNEGLTTERAVVSIPMLMPTTTTFHGIGKATIDRIKAIEKTENLINISWFHGFPYADTPHVGIHLVLTGVANQHNLAAIGESLAASIWAVRDEFRIPGLSATEALDQALNASSEGLAVINETSDNPGGGAPGDGTHLLKAMLEADEPATCFGFIVDPQVAALAHEMGVGAVLETELGGKTDAMHGEPLPVSAYVKALHDGKIIMQAMFKGTPMSLGPMARLVIGQVEVIVVSNRSQTFDTEPFLALGIDVHRMRVVALKSSNHFRAGFEPIAKTIITADTPGFTTHQIDRFEKTLSPHPLWPISPNAPLTFFS